MTVVAITATKNTRAKAAGDGTAPAIARAAAKTVAKRKALPELNEHILRAFEKAGGDAYLAEIARSHPAAFLGMLVKVLPLQVTGEAGGPVRFEKIERVIVNPSHTDAGGV